MYSKWTSHLATEQAKEEFRRDILRAKDVLDRQKQILNEEEAYLDRSEMNIKQFDQPNWEYRQAFKNGYRAALEIQKRLIDLDKQDIDFNERNVTLA